jgi:hypothetical protein
MNDDIARLQRIYDAMLIKAWRSDASLQQLWIWLKVYKIESPDKRLVRQPPGGKNIWGVRAFVGIFLKPLSDRLFDTERHHDLATLDWMTRWRCQDTTKTEQSEKAKIKREQTLQFGKRKVLANAFDAGRRTNQWGVTKDRGRVGRAK